MDYVRHNIIQVDPLPAHLFFLYHAADSANDIAGAARISADVSEKFPDLLQIHIAPINKALSGAGIAHNSCKRLIQFVRNGGGHLAYQRHTTQMTELVASLLGLEFRLFSSGNIDADSQQLGGFAMGIKAHTSTRRHPAHDSIRENEPILGIKVLALMNRVVDRLSNAIAIVGMQSRNKMLQGDFSGSRPSQEGPPRIGRPDLIFA